MKILLIILSILFAQTVHAVQFEVIPLSLKDRVYISVKTCGWDFFCYFSPNLGVSFTTINSTDKINTLPTNLNANFDLVNSGFVAVGSTSIAAITTLPGLTTASSLVTVGALSSGSLTTGFTAVNVAQGGTGSTTLMAYGLLLGSTTNAVSVVDGLGTSGQVLTSQGANEKPRWSAGTVDQTISYFWSGSHQFASSTHTGSTTLQANAAHLLRLNGVDYAFPSAQGASSTALVNNGSGVLAWGEPGETLLIATTTAANMFNATTSFTSYRFLRVVVDTRGCSADCNLFIWFNTDATKGNYGSVSDSINSAPVHNNGAQPSIPLINVATTSPAFFEIEINNTTATRKYVKWTGMGNASGVQAPDYYFGGGVWNNTSVAINQIVIGNGPTTDTVTAGTQIYVFGRN